MGFRLVPVEGEASKTIPKITPIDSEGEALGVGLADLDFQSDLINSGSQDPTSQLGFDIGAAHFLSNPDNADRAFHLMNLGSRQKEYEFYAQEGLRRSKDDVFVGAGVNTPAIWNHEFRHRGFEALGDRFSDEDEVTKLFGDQGTRALSMIRGSKSDREALTELFDRPDDDAGVYGTIENTMEAVTPENREELRNTISAMSKQVLSERGSPDQAERKEPGFFAGVLNSMFGE
ncbi:MAG: hypothetical protein GQ574_14660 [Crocinitomix sp.]|nr:hypothetical protein [Crocinitomix sp.]